MSQPSPDCSLLRPLAVALLFAACAGFNPPAPAGAGGSSGSAGSEGVGTGGNNGGASGVGTGGRGVATGGAGPAASGGRAATGSGGGAAVAGVSGTDPSRGGATASTGGTQGTITRVDLTGKKALLIVDDPASLDDGDIALGEALGNRGMVVSFGGTTALAPGAAAMNLIVGSSGAAEAEFAPLYGGLAVPMIVFGGGYYQPLSFAAAGSANRGGNVTGTTKLTVIDGATPLAASFPTGMTLGVIGTTRSTQFYWGLPLGGPIKVAAVMGAPTEISVFAYDKGAMMAVGTAPARRVALGWNTDAVPDLSIEAFRLMNAAIDWTAGASP